MLHQRLDQISQILQRCYSDDPDTQYQGVRILRQSLDTDRDQLILQVVFSTGIIRRYSLSPLFQSSLSLNQITQFTNNQKLWNTSKA